MPEGSSSIGRVPVSKTEGWGFESLLPWTNIKPQHHMTFWNITFAIVAVLGLYYFLRYRVTILKFVGEVKVELDKCSWPGTRTRRASRVQGID